MDISLENENKIQVFSEINSFLKHLVKLSSKKEITTLLVNEISILIKSRFLSFVEQDKNIMKVLCKAGDDTIVKNIFTETMCNEIYKCVMSQKDSTMFKIAKNENFVFIPVIDFDKGNSIEHGMLVIQLENLKFEIPKELNNLINIFTRLSAMMMTRLLSVNEVSEHLKLKEDIKTELQSTAKLQRAMSCSEISKKLLFNVIEDEGSCFNGNLWWVSDLGADISLVLMAQIMSKGSPSAMLSGYILGEMNSLKTRAEISLKPAEVMRYLNQQLNPMFISTGITVNAWYGVFNTGAKNVRFSTANYPAPFLIGPEQQVSNLFVIKDSIGQSLGINLNSVFKESHSNISSGSKLVICTRELLEQAAKIGDSYDNSWLPQVLETLGSLSLKEMRNNLESILSENIQGTVKSAPRLALLLEVPA